MCFNKKNAPVKFISASSVLQMMEIVKKDISVIWSGKHAKDISVREHAKQVNNCVTIENNGKEFLF